MTMSEEKKIVRTEEGYFVFDDENMNIILSRLSELKGKTRANWKYINGELTSTWQNKIQEQIEELKQKFIDSCVNKERHERLHKNSFKRQKRMESVLKEQFCDTFLKIIAEDFGLRNDKEREKITENVIKEIKEQLEDSEKRSHIGGVGGAAPTRNAEHKTSISTRIESDDSKESSNRKEWGKELYSQGLTVGMELGKKLSKEKEPSKICTFDEQIQCASFMSIICLGDHKVKGKLSKIITCMYGKTKLEQLPNEKESSNEEFFTGFIVKEKFIPPRNLRCEDCMANPIPELISQFKRIVDRTMIRMKGKYGYRAKGNEYLEKILNQELKDLKRGRQ